MNDGWVCAICERRSEDGKAHDEWCPNHPERRVIRLEQRVAALEEAAAKEGRP